MLLSNSFKSQSILAIFHQIIYINTINNLYNLQS